MAKMEQCCPGGAHDCHTCRVCSGAAFGCKSCLKCISCPTCIEGKCVMCKNGSPRQKANAAKYGKK
ncbi:hypothetical protein [Spiroplasma endosymbiont of Labia minor]|uniref:hypothetical protein n=1 Tax=Spiroplasma endosymbiont of Labia minor TaxID=3066305 RepID=UPI0030D5C78B